MKGTEYSMRLFEESLGDARMLPKAVLWDMDGVLIDSEPGYNEATGSFIRSLGYEFGAREIAKVTGVSYKNLAAILDLKEPPEKFMHLYAEILMQSVRTTIHELIGGVTDFLDYFKLRGVKMAVGSSSPRELVDYVIDTFGLSRWIQFAVTGSDTENGKPAPDIYRMCAEQLEVLPSECLVIEDSRNGIRSARAAGMIVLAYAGTNRCHLDLSEADFTIQSYSQEELSALVQWLDLWLTASL